MNEKDLKVFIEMGTHYFSQITGDACKMGVPFIRNKDPYVLDYTGVIGVSGVRRGGIYITCSQTMLRELAGIMLGEDLEGDDMSIDDEAIVDIVGEMTNTISGNARKHFGSGFMISVPIILKGKPEDIIMRLEPPVFVIPINWREHNSFLAIGLE